MPPNETLGSAGRDIYPKSTFRHVHLIPEPFLSI